MVIGMMLYVEDLKENQYLDRGGINMNVKKTLLGLTIFGAGAGLGYFICKKRLTAQYQEDVAEVKQFYMNKIEELGVMDEDFDPEDLNDGDTEDEDDEDEDPNEEEVREYYERVMKYSSAIQQGDRGRPIINYNKPPLEMRDWGDIEDEGDIEENSEDEDPMDLAYEAELEARAEEYAKRRHENMTNGLPYVIDHEEYENGPDEYERQFLYYYSADRVLCEDNDSVVEDEEVLVGFDYEDTLDMQTTAWVRNDQIMVLYEIHRVDESYARTVANAIETPKEREFRILGRRKQALDD